MASCGELWRYSGCGELWRVVAVICHKLPQLATKCLPIKVVITALPLYYRYRHDRHYRYRLDERGGNYRHNGKINANNGTIFPNLETNRGNE